ncbi:hypothetical protein ONZ51_g6372 [Trametes cubensis]|uniref:Uncharacterized protein n=1 Tax=Trametes cubensis TaxID=1111947 RepID=A0AAD7TUD2_9APHY|nr:hypothetical protein ONZ51_g6372 [Trametes cubensis]
MADDPSVALAVNDDHPLALELASLRSAVARYQHEAHATSLKLQRHSLEASQAIEHARALERENARLKEEVTVLRANPETTPNQATTQVSELTLALRRLSDKLTAVEETLLVRTKELADARSELANAQHEIEAARALAADARAREEEGLAREREQGRKLKAAEEERRMADLVVQEYANLVRKLEGRARAPSGASSASSIDLQRHDTGSTTTLVDSLSEGKLGLQKLLEEFNGQNERLEAEIAKLHGDNGLLYKELEVARLGAEHDRRELANAIQELDKYRADDNTATKMVSRYMKFSQSATDKLQQAIDALKARHAATLATLNAEIAHLQRALEHERAESDRVRSALDELTEDIAREAYGRRREVSLRLAFLGREENLAESLRRWIRRGREALERSSGDTGDSELDAMVLREAFSRAVLDAEDLLETLNSQPSADDRTNSSGSIARLILAQDAVSSLTHELQEETVRRLRTERKLAQLETPGQSDGIPLQMQTKHVVQPVPHRASIGQADKPMLDRNGSSASTADSTPSPHDTLSTENLPTIDVSVEDIVLAPTVDSLPQGHESSSELPETPTVEAADTQILPANQATPAISPVKELPPNELGVTTAPAEIPSADSQTTVLSSSQSDHSPDPVPSAPVLSTTPVHGDERPTRATVPPPLQLDATDGSALSLLPLTPASPARPATEAQDVSILASLAKIKTRYDDVQRGFRDCHLALKELKKSLAEVPAQGSGSDLQTLLRKAVDRLGDFNEDARVELEIRIADEERVASGYEALLSIPGAMNHSDDSDRMDSNDVYKEITAFVNGTDRSVAKATQSFSQKLDDLEHDIASIKRTLHELALASPDGSLSAAVPSARTSTSPSWSSWTPSFLSPPRSTSPAPTFGSVMTSPRLRHSSSFTHPRESSAESPTDPLANLGLRIAVPSPVRSPTYGALSAGAGPGIGGPHRAGPRQRTTSGMFMLGLGMRSASIGSGLGVHASASASKSSLAGLGTSASPSSSRLAAVSPRKEESSEGEDDDVDSDVE